MINRLRRKFILICAISVFTVVALIFVLIAVLNVSSMNQTLDTLTDSLSEGDGRFPDSFDDREPIHDVPPKKPVMDFITPETPYSTRHFTVWFDGDGGFIHSNTDFIHAVTEDTAKEYAEKAIQSDDMRGWLSNYRYKIYSANDGTAVVFVDGTMNRSSLFQSLVIAAAVLIVAALVILFLIVLLSKRVMQPIAQSYEKQKQFVTDANHELKTPLTLILANLDIAEAELGKNEWLEDIRAEGNRMTGLVNQLVALSRMDEEGQPVSEVLLPLGEIVMETVAEFESLSIDRSKRITADIDTGIHCFGDEALIRKLVGILMDNAIKYCDDGGEIRVELKCRRHTVLTVENTYSAVNEEELPRLFDRFYRADKARTFTGGYGIGLSIAKSIVEKHHGEIIAYKADSTRIGFKVTLKK